MGKIIFAEEANNYNIQKFQFSSFNDIDKTKIIKSDLKQIFTKKEEKKEQSKKKDKDEFEKLLKKVDELSSKVVSLELELEQKEKEFEQKLEEEKQKAYKEGIKEAQKSYEEEIEELKNQYISSITSIQELGIKINEQLELFEKELLETSIIIAQKVIQKEVDKNSKIIAKNIIEHILDDIKENLDVKILVNAEDFKFLKQHIKEDVKILPSKKVKKGGAIILSDKKNIDATIQTRLKKTLQLIKES